MVIEPAARFVRTTTGRRPPSGQLPGCDAHLSDIDLTPQTVAAAMGISIRHVHNVFNSGERTIARYIRDRRIEAIAFSLRTSTDQVPLAELAGHHGFASVDAMRRAFRDRFGMSPAEYRAGGHRASDDVDLTSSPASLE